MTLCCQVLGDEDEQQQQGEVPELALVAPQGKSLGECCTKQGGAYKQQARQGDREDDHADCYDGCNLGDRIRLAQEGVLFAVVEDQGFSHDRSLMASEEGR